MIGLAVGVNDEEVGIAVCSLDLGVGTLSVGEEREQSAGWVIKIGVAWMTGFSAGGGGSTIMHPSCSYA